MARTSARVSAQNEAAASLVHSHQGTRRAGVLRWELATRGRTNGTTSRERSDECWAKAAHIGCSTPLGHVSRKVSVVKAYVGQRIVLASATLDEPLRDGEILEVHGADGTPPYLIRWSDGHVGLFFPGPGSVLRIGEDHTGTPEPGATAGPAMVPEPSPSSASRDEGRHVHDWQVRVRLFESTDDTHAEAVLLADSPHHLVARGQSTRGPHDRPVPEIGDEVAVARALRHLADELVATAEGDIEALTGEHDVVVRPT